VTETSILLGIEQQQAETQVYLLADVIYYTPQQLLRPSLIDSPSLLLLFSPRVSVCILYMAARDSFVVGKRIRPKRVNKNQMTETWKCFIVAPSSAEVQV
jgi:hypothetical protein